MASSTHSAARRSGFALLELLASIPFLVVAIMSLAQIALTTHQIQKSEVERQAAWVSLTEQIRLVEATPFAELEARHDGRAFDVFLDDRDSAALRPVEGDPDGLPGLITIATPPAPLDDPDLRLVTVRLEWVGSFAPQLLERSFLLSRVGAPQ